MKLRWKKNWWGKIFSSHVSSNSCRILLLFYENQKMVVNKTLYIYISCPTISFQSNIFYDYTKSLICAIFLLCVNTPTFDPLLRQTHTQTHTHTQYTRTQAHTRTRTHIHTQQYINIYGSCGSFPLLELVQTLKLASHLTQRLLAKEWKGNHLKGSTIVKPKTR